MSNQIIKLTGSREGGTVAVLGGVHGNERVGINLVQELMQNTTIDAGTLYLILANPDAIEINERFVDKNLNRCFLKDNISKTQEDQRARELMSILDLCDASLDIHSFTNPKGAPFVICDEKAFLIAEKFDVPVISFGWASLEPGATDDYMYNQGKIGICLESGSFVDYDRSYQRAQHAVSVFLEHFGIQQSLPSACTKSKRYIRAHTAVLKKTDAFSFAKDYSNFELLEENTVFARDGRTEYLAKRGDCIILPTPKEPIGGEVFLLGYEVKDMNT